MMDLPAIAVVIPTYNRAEDLRRCLTSLYAGDYAGSVQIVVVDDGSTDHTPDVAALRVASEAMLQHSAGIAAPQVAYVRQDNRGPAAARNRGVAVACRATLPPDILAFTDDDCILPSDWLRRLADGYRRYPQVAGVGGYLRPPASAEGRSPFARYEWLLARSYGVGESEVIGGFECPAGGTANMSYRLNVFRAVGGFDETFPAAGGEDADLKWRVCQTGAQLLYVPAGAVHQRPYSWRSFVRQQTNRGRGASHFEAKHCGRRPGPGRIALRFGKRTLSVFRNLIGYREKRLALIDMLAGWLEIWGEWQEWRDMGRAPVHAHS